MPQHPPHTGEQIKKKPKTMVFYFPKLTNMNIICYNIVKYNGELYGTDDQ